MSNSNKEAEKLRRYYPKMAPYNDAILLSLHRSLNITKDVSDVPTGENVNKAEVVVTGIGRAVDVQACPECRAVASKVKKEGTEYVCKSRRCGEKAVKTITKQIQKIRCGDVHGNSIILSAFPSSVDLDEEGANALIGKILQITGRRQDANKNGKWGNSNNIYVALSYYNIIGDAKPDAPIEEVPPEPEEVPNDKLLSLRAYFYMNQNKVTDESKLKTYITNNLGLKWESVASMIERAGENGGSYYFLKDYTLDQLKASVTQKQM